jgi:hypothetical protein
VYGIEYGASALAADTFLRYLLPAGVPLFSIQMIDRINVHWSLSIIGFISLLLVPIPWIVYKQGPRLRERSVYVKEAKTLKTAPESANDEPVAATEDFSYKAMDVESKRFMEVQEVSRSGSTSK